MKKCRVCKNTFTPLRPLQNVCSLDCAKDSAARKRIKAEKRKEIESRQQLRADKERIKTRSQWMKEAQQVFNAYIRGRDEKEPCISCQRHHNGQYHAGHFRTTAAAPELRFNELNVWKQCAPCNNHKHGNITEYRINLVKRIGIEKVEWLEGKHEPNKYTIDDLKAIKALYKAKLKELNNSCD